MEQTESTAANPVRRSRRRWFQFSIRTVLVVVTVLCVALSLWVVPAERQRRAVEAIEKRGGIVFYVGEQTASDSIPKSPLTLRRWLPRVYFNEVAEVHLIHCTEVTDDPTFRDFLSEFPRNFRRPCWLGGGRQLAEIVAA